MGAEIENFATPHVSGLSMGCCVRNSGAKYTLVSSLELAAATGPMLSRAIEMRRNGWSRDGRGNERGAR